MSRSPSIILAGWEASAMAALESGSTMLLSRPMNPQPKGKLSHVEYLYWRPYKPGDVLLCREAFQPIFADPKVAGDWKTGDGYMVNYVATSPRVCWYDLGRPTERAFQASRMPLWAVRMKPTVMSVRAVRIAETSSRDADRHEVSSVGVVVGGVEYACNTNGDYVLSLRQCWERRWGKRYPWASNPWAWTMEVRR